MSLVEIIHTQENTPFPDTDLLSDHIGEEERSMLIERNILRPVKGEWIFDFVGLLALSKVILVIHPKVINSRELEDNTQLLVNVLKKYRDHLEQHVDGVDYFNNDEDELHNINEIELADAIIDDYLKYGIWQKREKNLKLNSPGEIYWEKTVEEQQPIFSDGSPIYHNTINIKRQSNEEDLVTKIHKWAVKYCTEKYAMILGYDIDYHGSELTDLLKIGSAESISYNLRKQLYKVYSDREIRLFKLLIALVNTSKESKRDKIQLFGTKAFHQIWEVACAVYFGNDYSKIKEYMPSPVWNINSGYGYESDTLIPDIVLIPEKSEKGYVLDAKYYNMKLNQNKEKIINHPGISDLIKQYKYAELISGLINRGVINAFLFPSDEVEYPTCVGRVDFHNESHEKGIHLFYLPIKKLLQGYITDNRVHYDYSWIDESVVID